MPPRPWAAAAAGLAGAGLCVLPGFLDDGQVAALAAEARARWRDGAFHPARVGTGARRTLRPEVRCDRVAWVEPGAATPALGACLAALEQLRVEINRLTYLGLFDLECHLTVYPPGAYYRRHLDRSRDAAHRLVSCIVYLNEGWQADDGGALRLYDDTGTGFRDVLPDGGTLVTFMSERFEHEVLPARRERWSLTGWFCARAGGGARG